MSKSTDKKYVDSLLEFLDNSPCNFLAVDTVKKILTANGFKEKKIDDKMNAKAGEKFGCLLLYAGIDTDLCWYCSHSYHLLPIQL